jgi:transcriptional regulator with XRE-family HTH domain
MTLATGNQLKAARALAEMDQGELASEAGVNVNTIRNMEARRGELITSGAVTVRNVQVVLEARGVEFLNHGQPGVRLRTSSGVPEPKHATTTRTPAQRKPRKRQGGRKP